MEEAAVFKRERSGKVSPSLGRPVIKRFAHAFGAYVMDKRVALT